MTKMIKSGAHLSVKEKRLLSEILEQNADVIAEEMAAELSCSIRTCREDVLTLGMQYHLLAKLEEPQSTSIAVHPR